MKKKEFVELKEETSLSQDMSKSISSCSYTKEAMDLVLTNLRVKHDSLSYPKDKLDSNELIDYFSKPYGIYHREVKLDNAWYKHAFGPMLGTLKESNQVVPLIPDKIRGYYYYDFKLQKKIRLNKKTNSLINENATYFYRPFPLKQLKIKDLIWYALTQIRFSDIFFFIIILILSTAIGMLAPMATNVLFGYVVSNRDLDVLLSMALFMVFLTVGRLVFACYDSLFKTNLGIKIDTSVSAAIMQRVLSLPATFFSKYSAGEVSSRSKYISNLITTSIYMVGVSSIEAIFSFAYIFQIFMFAPKLVLPSFLLIIVNVIFSVIMAIVREREIKKHIQFAIDESSMTYALIEGMEKIKMTNSEERMYERWSKTYEKSIRFSYKPRWFIKYSSTFNMIISLGGTMLLYYVALASKIDVASYYAFMSAYGLSSAGFMAAVHILESVCTIRPSYQMSKPILDEIPEIDISKKILTTISGNIAFNNVTFSYENSNHLVLDNISFNIKEGEYVAIVGKTGCGKSTIMKLILGFIKPDSGNITFDSHDVNELDLPCLRSHIGSVMQDCRLFTGDIFNNITITAPGACEDDAWEAAKIAHIDEDISNLPMGMHTYISEGSGGVSGGQKQRLAIARAVVHKPKLLIFDEATSALDNITQKAVSDSIDRLNCTRIVFAHRLSTIKNCDRIILIDDGKVAEEGSYKELIKLNKKFAKLVARQRIKEED